MGAMIGINTMLLIASIVFIAKKDHPLQFERSRVIMTRGITVANGSLVAFWVSLIGAGLVKIAGQIDNLAFATIMKNCEPLFKWFAMSGVLIVVGLLLMILPLMRVLMSRRPVRVRPAVTIEANRPTA
jgi:nitric oxide reductase subunit B